MIPGFNQNVKFNESDYHVQTEDSGLEYGHVITHIYRGGVIIASRKTSYEDIAGNESIYDIVKEIMEEQHRSMVQNLLSGTYTSEANAADKEEKTAEIQPLNSAAIVGLPGQNLELDESLVEFFSDVLISEI